MPKRTINVSGMSIEDIMNLGAGNIMRLNETDLRAVTTRLVSASNKRLARLKKAGINYTPAMHKIYTQGATRFSVKGKNRNQLMHEFANVRNFLNDKTSSVSGYKKFAKKFAETFGQDYQDTLNEKSEAGQNFRSIVELIEEIKRIWPEFALMTFSEQYVYCVNLLHDNGNDFDAALAWVRNMVKERAAEQRAYSEAATSNMGEDLGAYEPDTSEWMDLAGLEDEELPFDSPEYRRGNFEDDSWADF